MPTDTARIPGRHAAAPSPLRAARAALRARTAPPGRHRDRLTDDLVAVDCSVTELFGQTATPATGGAR